MPKAAKNKQALEYELARLSRDLTTAVTWYMKENHTSQRDLAFKMGVTPGRVSQILSGDENLTVRTLAAVFVALDAHMVGAEIVSNRGEHRGVDDIGFPNEDDFPDPRPAPVPVPAFYDIAAVHHHGWTPQDTGREEQAGGRVARAVARLRRSLTPPLVT